MAEQNNFGTNWLEIVSYALLGSLIFAGVVYVMVFILDANHS